MVQRLCPYCKCEDSCGREGSFSRPYSHSGPTPTEVYAPVCKLYGCDQNVLDVEAWHLAQDLVSLGHLNPMPKLSMLLMSRHSFVKLNASNKDAPATAGAERTLSTLCTLLLVVSPPRLSNGTKKS